MLSSFRAYLSNLGVVSPSSRITTWKYPCGCHVKLGILLVAVVLIWENACCSHVKTWRDACCGRVNLKIWLLQSCKTWNNAYCSCVNLEKCILQS